MKTSAFLTLVLATLVKLTSGEDDIELEQYEYGLFENMEGTKTVLLKDIEITKNLRKLKEELLAKKKAIDDILEVTKKKVNLTESFIDHPVNAYRMIKSHVAVLWDKPDILKAANESQVNIGKNIERQISENFTTSSMDYTGAMKGIIVLQDTFRFTEEPLAVNNTIMVPNLRSRRVDIPGYYNFTFTDFYKMANISMHQLWYDTAIFFTRTADIKLKSMTKVTNSMKEDLKRMKKNLKHLNNQWLLKTKTVAGKVHKVLPYTVDKNLNKAKKQPLEGQQLDYVEYGTSMGKEYQFRSVCRNFFMKHFFIHPMDTKLKCHLLHHNDPYLKLGPQPLEIVNEMPYVAIFHKLFSNAELDYMVNDARPNLSKSRGFNKLKQMEKKTKTSDKKAVRFIQKTIVHWFWEREWKDFDYITEDNLYDDDHNITIPLIVKMTEKLQIMTRMNITGKLSSTQYQVTNYGLGGLCDTHIDPSGYWEGRDVGPSRYKLKYSGDMIATLMGWLGPEPEGGATAFITPYKEMLVHPTKGSMAFWFDINGAMKRDQESTHGGCPILKGSKWIVNKWVYAFDQWKTYPCRLDSSLSYDGFKGLYKTVSS